jgi:hypothetical protein
MSNQPYPTHRQLPLWETEAGTGASPVILTNEQQEELTAALTELLLLNVVKPAAVRKGVHDAE